MRLRMFVSLTLALNLGFALAAQEPKFEFQQFASSAGKYKVLFPGPVATEAVAVKTSAGAQSLTLDSVSLPGEILFVVSYIDLPADAANSPSAPRLDRIRDAAKGNDGKLLSEKNLTVGLEKYPARDIVIEKPGATIRTRIILTDKRLYQVMIQGSKDLVGSPTADRFLDSFEVTK